MQDEIVLVDCPSCGGQNHPARARCGRCRALLPSEEPALAAATGADDPTTALDTHVAREPEADTPPIGARAATRADARPTPREDAGPEARAEGRPDARPAARAGATAAATGARVVDLLRGTTPGDTQPLDPVPAPTVEPRPLRARPLVLVTLAGLALGVVVGLLGFLELRGDGESGAPLPAFDEAVYPGEAGPLAIEEVGATSQLPPAGDNTYEAALVLDGDPATAWNSDGSVRADGIGEVFSVRLDEPAWVTSIELANGYQRDDVRFLANARISRATLTFDRGVQVNVVLLDRTGRQRVPLPEPILTTGFTITVRESFEGDTHDDLALSELRAFGHGALGVDVQRALDVAPTDRAVG